jgi:hypothetical protein
MATAFTLLGAVLAPAATVFLSDKLTNQSADKQDTINRALEKRAGVGLAFALAGWGISAYGGRSTGKMYDFGTGMILGGGVTSGLALGQRLITSKAEGDLKLPAKVQGVPYAYAPIAGLPPHVRMGRHGYQPAHARTAY